MSTILSYTVLYVSNEVLAGNGTVKQVEKPSLLEVDTFSIPVRQTDIVSVQYNNTFFKRSFHKSIKECCTIPALLFWAESVGSRTTASACGGLRYRLYCTVRIVGIRVSSFLYGPYQKDAISCSTAHAKHAHTRVAR